MTASLYQSPSLSRTAATGDSSASMEGIRFITGPSRQAAKEHGGIARRVYPQPNAAPFDRIPLAGDQVFDGGDVAALAAVADLDIAERKPEFVRLARQRDGHRHAVGLVDRFLDKADDIGVIDRNEAQIAGLLQRCVGAAGAIEVANIGLDMARFVPISHLELVFLGIKIFFPARNRVVFYQFESVVDAVIAGQ